MTPYYTDDWLTLYGGDCRDVLRELPSDSVDCVVTSPPYWGLRDYGTATWIGGDAGCDHLGPPRMSDKTGLSHPELKPREQILAEPSRLVATPYRDICGKCGAMINNQRTRCKKCSGLLAFPTKNRKRKTKHRTLKHRGKKV